MPRTGVPFYLGPDSEGQSLQGSLRYGLGRVELCGEVREGQVWRVSEDRSGHAGPSFLGMEALLSLPHLSLYPTPSSSHLPSKPCS